jgi:hypothetical protein
MVAVLAGRAAQRKDDALAVVADLGVGRITLPCVKRAVRLCSVALADEASRSIRSPPGALLARPWD